MKVTSMVCCENIVQDGNTNKANLIAPLQIIKLINLPSSYSFSVSVGLIDVDKNGKSIVSINILDPKDCEVNAIENINLPAIPEQVDEKVPYGIIMNFDVRNMVFYKEGRYKIIVSEVIDNGEKRKLNEFYIEVLK